MNPCFKFYKYAGERIGHRDAALFALALEDAPGIGALAFASGVLGHFDDFL